MSKLGKIFCLMASVALWQGCSSTSDNGDAAISDAGSDTSSVFLSRGANNYKVTMVSVTSDGCMLNVPDLLNTTLPVNFVESTQMLSVGKQVGSPLQASLGTGVVGTTGTLTRENDVVDTVATTCSWHQMDVSQFDLTGGDV